MRLLLCVLALLSSAADIKPPEPPSHEGKASSGEMVMRTDSGELRWQPGSAEVEVRDKSGALVHRIPLARPDRPAPKSAEVSLRALLPSSGSHFLVVEETRKPVGLHLNERQGANKPKALVVRSLLRLVHESSRVIWERRTEDKTAVGDSPDAQHLQIAPDGTTALLLQDVDPYAKNRPVLSVIDSGGRETLRLDYTSWTRVDEFALSPDGKSLAVHGFGLVPEDEEMSRAVGFWRIGKKTPKWVKALPRLPSPRLRLAAVDADGVTCCVDTPDGWLGYGETGAAKKFSAAEMQTRFGIKP
ncbi:MAG: hypothetical protein HY925_08085 [Elusimicrobia bacterium]|nr:hypothetical protein [Elusimicrobiota bacterium]